MAGKGDNQFKKSHKDTSHKDPPVAGKGNNQFKKSHKDTSHKDPPKDYSQVLCFICQELGHMSHNCPRVQDRKVVKGSESAKKADVEKAAVVTECAGQASAVAEHEVNSTSSNVFHWNADTGATSHMTPHKNWIHNYRPYRVLVKLADHRI